MTNPPRVQFTIRYLGVLAPASLVWETAHMPLYALWLDASYRELAYAIIHCTGGDILIGGAALLLAFRLFGGSEWPRERVMTVAVTTLAFGLGYTMFSEWFNVEFLHRWAYRDIMPRLPLTGTGITPLLQWLVIPALAYRIAWNRTSGRATNSSRKN